MIEELEKLYSIYTKIDSTEMHKKYTNMKSMKLATILNRFFYYVEYSIVLIKQKDVTNFNYYRYNLVISIGRNIMELFNVYEYFGEYGITKEEYELRELCADLHETLNKERIDKKLKEYNKEKFNQMNHFIPVDNYKMHIENNMVFQKSNEKWQKNILDSRKCYYFSRVNHKLNILPHSLESVLYNIFSNYVHSFELALGYDFIRNNIEMYSGLFQAILTIQVMALYAAIMLKDYVARRNLKKVLTKEDLLFLNSFITYEPIENTLVNWRNKYDINKIFESFYS